MRLELRLMGRLAAASLFTLSFAACGDDDDNINTNGTGNAGDNAGDNAGNNGGRPSLQQDAVDGGQLSWHDGSGLSINPVTLAIDVSATQMGPPSTALPAGMVDAPFYGAVDPAADTAWWSGWTYINPEVDGSLPGELFHPLAAEIGDTITGAAQSGCAGLGLLDGGSTTVLGHSFPVCVLKGRVEADLSLPNDHVFVIDGTVTVGNGDTQLSGDASGVSEVTVTIAAGSMLFAAADTASSLVISRGSKIDAVGTAEMPIIFGAVEATPGNAGTGDVITGDVTDLSGRGQWGGIVLSGFGRENSADENGELTTEAAPPSEERWFGGDDNADSSGTLRYLVIAESGFEFRMDEEVQGLTIEAAGSGTSLEYIQVVGSEDDCVEWFGGAAPMKWLVCNGVDDDGLDIDEGYQGNIQFALVRIGVTNGEHGIESDGNGSNFDATPYTAPKIANVTVLGNSGRQSKSTRGALHREGFRAQIYRSVFTDDIGGAFEDGCVDIDDVLPSELAHYDSVMNCTGGPLAAPDDDNK